MKRIIGIVIMALILASCQPAITIIQEVEPSDDPRLSMVDAMDAKFLRLPGGKGIADGDPVAEYCTEPGWSYIFFDDEAVIGYEPFPDAVDVMQRAVAITVESHNLEYPEAEWDFINVGLPVDLPVTTFDPVLDVWQVALCLDDGTIVAGPYTAEFEFNWLAFKANIPTEVASYNLDHPDTPCHAVWGPEKPVE